MDIKAYTNPALYNKYYSYKYKNIVTWSLQDQKHIDRKVPDRYKDLYKITWMILKDQDLFSDSFLHIIKKSQFFNYIYKLYSDQIRAGKLNKTGCMGFYFKFPIALCNINFFHKILWNQVQELKHGIQYEIF